MANNTTGFTRIIKAAGYSWKGFRAAWTHEAAFRQESIAVLLGVIIACWLDVDAITRVLLIGSVLLIMIVESSTALLKRSWTASVLNTMSFPAVRRYGIGCGATVYFRCPDDLGHPVMVTFSIKVPNFINLLFFAPFVVPKSPLTVYTHSMIVYTPRGRNESVNGQATRGV